MGATVKVGPKGRVVIPIDARRALEIDEGDDLCVVVHRDSLELMTRAAVLARLQDLGRATAEEGSLVDDLISERRAAARAEAEEAVR